MDAVGPRAESRRYDDLEAKARRLDGPRPPERITFRRTFPVGRRWRSRAYVDAVEALMEGRPYAQVVKEVGTDAELVARHAFGDGLPGPRPSRRSRVVYLRYVRTATAAVPAHLAVQ